MIQIFLGTISGFVAGYAAIEAWDKFQYWRDGKIMERAIAERQFLDLKTLNEEFNAIYRANND